MATNLTTEVVSLLVLILICSGGGKQVSKRFMWDILTLPFDSQHRCLECYNCNCHWKHHMTECSDPYHADGGWGSWTSWSNCSTTTCGYTGTKTRTRLCDSPKPHNCGRFCNGSFTEDRNCDPCNPIVPTTTFSSQSLTTAPDTSVAPQTTIPPVMPTMCNKFCAISHVANSKPYEHPDASTCPDGTHSGREALPLVCCIVPPMSTWKEGLNVMSNCNKIPLYSPIAIFTFGHYVTGTAGIFTSCLSNGNYGFQMTLQTCGHVASLENVVKNITVDGHPDAYYTVQ